MKIIVIVFSALAFALAACGSNETTPAVTAPTALPPAVTAQPASQATSTPNPAPTAAIPAAIVPPPTVAPAATLIAMPANTPTPAPTSTPEPTPVATEAEHFLQLVDPEELEIITEEPNIQVVGRTRVDAVVTVNDAIVEPDSDGLFASTVELEEGPNVIEVISSVSSGEQKDLVLVAIYLP